MIRHIVFFKFKDNTSANIERVRERISSLKDKIEVIRFMEIGINFSTEDRAYDMALTVDFDNIEDLNSYAVNPLHLEVISYIKSFLVETKVVDYAR